jgi:hypothetical protein
MKRGMRTSNANAEVRTGSGASAFFILHSHSPFAFVF